MNVTVVLMALNMLVILATCIVAEGRMKILKYRNVLKLLSNWPSCSLEGGGGKPKMSKYLERIFKKMI